MEKQKQLLDHLKPVEIDMPQDAFFSELANKVVHQAPIRKLDSAFRRKKWLYIALSAAAVFIIGLIFINQQQNTTQNIDLAQAMSALSHKEMSDYIMVNQLDFDHDDHAFQMEYETKELEVAVEEETASLEELFSDLTQKEIDRYFESEGINPEELEEDELYH
jgi:IS1 family transposase